MLCQLGVIALAVCVLCLALNAFFVAAEFALVKVRVTEVEPRARRGEKRAVAARHVLERLDRYLSVTQFGITVASLGLGWIGEPALSALAERIAGRALGEAAHVAVDVAALGLLTYLHLLLGELVPKFIAIQKAHATVMASALPLRIVYLVFRPLLVVLEVSQRLVLRAIGLRADANAEGRLSEEEILGILAANAAGSPAARDKQRVVERVMRFATRPVRLAMVPRVDVFTVPVTTSIGRLVELLREHQFSRIPVTRDGSPDDIVGYVYAKDLLVGASMRRDSDLSALRRHVMFVPETRTALEALRDMQRTRHPIAVVVDEYGGTRGIVTIEDLMEEVFGDIRDELDVEPQKVRRAGPRVWEVDATASMDDLRALGVPVPEEDLGQRIETRIAERLGHLPHVGDVVELGPGTKAEVLSASRRRVRRVRVITDEGSSPRS